VSRGGGGAIAARPGSAAGVIRARRRGRSRLLGAAKVSTGRLRGRAGGWALLGSGDGAPDHPSNLVRESAVLRRSAVRDGAGSTRTFVYVEPRAQRGWLDWAHCGRRRRRRADDADHPPRARCSLTLYYRKRSGQSPEQRACPRLGGCAPYCAPTELHPRVFLALKQATPAPELFTEIRLF
jgi:hypothetical protein